MADNAWIGVVGALGGSAVTFLGALLTTWFKDRSDKRVRLQERQFKLEDDERARRLAKDAADAEEDKYWFDRSLEFHRIEARIMMACNKQETLDGVREFQGFLSENRECLLIGENMFFIHRFLTAGALDQITSPKDMLEQQVTSGTRVTPWLVEFVMALQKFKVPHGKSIHPNWTNLSQFERNRVHHDIVNRRYANNYDSSA